MDAVIIAGGIPTQDELLYPFTQGKPKAMLDIHGKPMVQWVLDAFGEAKLVENVTLIGLTPESGLTCLKPLTFIPNQDGMLENLIAGINKVLELNPSAKKVLLCTADIPGISPQMVDWEIQTTSNTDVDLCYSIVKREVMEKRYPSSKRTFTKLKGLEVCGADMHVIHTSVITMNREIWEKLVASRKNPFKQAAILGIDTLILMMLRVIPLEQAIQRITARLHMTGTAVITPYAEMAMDVDKPNQLELLRADLASVASQ